MFINGSKTVGWTFYVDTTEEKESPEVAAKNKEFEKYGYRIKKMPDGTWAAGYKKEDGSWLDGGLRLNAPTMEDAASYIQSEINRKEESKELEAKEKAAKEKAENQKREVEAGYGTFFSGKDAKTKAREINHLEKRVNFGNGKIQSYKEYIEEQFKNGDLEIGTHEENKLKGPSRRAYNRMDGRQQEEYERRIQAAGKKTVYEIKSKSEDGYYDLGKIAYDYAKYLIDNGGIKKSFLEQIEEISKSVKEKSQSEQKHDLEYYKKWAMSILDKQEETVDEPNEETIVKALAYTEIIAKAGYPVGTIREWKGKKYIKIAPNQWKPKYDNMGSRGAKMSLSNLKKAVAKCNSEEELFNLINSNASRFRDENGRPFPEVQELHDLINKRQDEINTPENNVEKPENGSGNENGSDNGNTAPEDSGKEPEKKKKTPISDKISAIQNAGNKGKMEVEKLSQGNVEGVAADAGDDTVNAVKNAAKSDKELLESYPTNVSGKEYFETFLSRTKSDEDHFSHAFDQLDNTRNYDDRDEIKGDIISLLYSYQRDIDDIGSDKKALAKMRELFDNAEKDEYNSSPEYLKNAFEQLKKIKEETKYEKISDAIKRSRELDDLNREIEESGKTVAEFLRDKNKKKDEEGMSNKAEQDQDSRVGSSALWDQNVKNAIKTGDANQIKSAIAKVEKEYEILSKRAKTENEKEFLEYELKYRKRDAENALKELNTKIDGGKKETLESLTEKYNATKDPDEREKILNEMMNLDRQDEEKTLPAMFDKEDESFDAWDKDQKAKYGDKSVEELQKLLDTKYKNVKKYTPEYSEAMKIGDMIQQKKRQKK